MHFCITFSRKFIIFLQFPCYFLSKHPGPLPDTLTTDSSCKEYPPTEYIGASLSQMVYLTNKMLVESIENMNDLYPPPQTFRKKKIILKDDDANCDAIIDGLEQCTKNQECSAEILENLRKTLNLELPKRTKKNAEIKVALEAALGTPSEEHKQEEIGKGELEIPPESNNNEKLFALFLKKKTECLASPIRQIKDSRATTFNIPLNYPQFRRFDRVRIEDIQVKVVGPNMRSKFVEVSIENNGVLQDRLDGNTFTFTGEPWQRTIRTKQQVEINRNTKSAEMCIASLRTYSLCRHFLPLGGFRFRICLPTSCVKFRRSK